MMKYSLIISGMGNIYSCFIETEWMMNRREEWRERHGILWGMITVSSFLLLLLSVLPTLIFPEVILDNTWWQTISYMSLDSDSALLWRILIQDLWFSTAHCKLSTVYFDGFYDSCQIYLLKRSICLKIIPFLLRFSERNKEGTILKLKGGLK